MVTGILVGAAVLALGTTAFAHERGGGGKNGENGGKHEGIGRMMDELNLTGDQQVEIGRLQQELTLKTKPIEQKIHALKEQKRAAWKSDKPEEAKIVALHREMLTLKGGLEELRIANRFAMRDVLTSDQRVALSKLREGRPERGNRDPDESNQ